MLILDLSPGAYRELRARVLAPPHARAAVRPGPDGREILELELEEITFRAERRPGVVIDEPDTTLTHIELGSLISRATKEGRVELSVNDTNVQMSLDKAREVHGMLGAAIEAAVSDQVMFAFLTQHIGLPEPAAAAALVELRALRQGSRGTVYPT